MNKQQLFQFSKKVVLLVVISVTILTAYEVTLCYLEHQMVEATVTMTKYIEFSTWCFLAYSGNSVAEKWFNKKYGESITNTVQDHYEPTIDDQGNG